MSKARAWAILGVMAAGFAWIIQDQVQRSGAAVTFEKALIIAGIAAGIGVAVPGGAVGLMSGMAALRGWLGRVRRRAGAAQRGQVLARSPYVIETYWEQGMEGELMYWIIDSRQTGKGTGGTGSCRQTRPPRGTVHTFWAADHETGRRQAEDWIVQRTLAEEA